MPIAGCGRGPRVSEEPEVSPVAAASRLREAIVLIAALAAIALAARLGFWQLDRAAQKLALQAALVARASEPALDAASLARRHADVLAQTFRRVHLAGRWVNEGTVFLDNRQMDAKVGFFVVTPLLLEGASGDAVLVQRGWIARNFNNRATLPAIVTPLGRVEIEATIAAEPSRMFEFSATASGAIRQNVELAPFARETGLALLPLAVVEQSTAENSRDGLERHWPPPATDVQMHYGYAFQWFAIGAVIAFLYVWFRIFRPRRRRRS
jgi:surfeit locus 1 family protein